MSDDRADAKTILGGDDPGDDDGGGSSVGLGSELLTTLGGGGRTIDGGKTLAYASVPGQSPADPSAIRPPPVIAGYEILGELGRGAVGGGRGLPCPTGPAEIGPAP